MKSIPLAQAVSLLEKTVAVIVDESILSFPTIRGLRGEPNNVFLEIDWKDQEGSQRLLEFKEVDNQEIIYAENSLFVKEFQANEIRISLLGPLPVSWMLDALNSNKE